MPGTFDQTTRQPRGKGSGDGDAARTMMRPSASQEPTRTSVAHGPPRSSGVQGPPRPSAEQGPPRTSGVQGPPRSSAALGPPRSSAALGPPRSSAALGPPRSSAAQGPPGAQEPPRTSGAPGGGGDTGIHDADDETLAAFFQEVKQDETEVARNVRKASVVIGQAAFKLGPDFIDEDYLECTPVPLYEQMIPVLDYDVYLDKSQTDLVQVTPIRPQTFSALFAFYRDRAPALNWNPSLTDIEEDCFFQEILKFPTSKLAHILPREKKSEKMKKRRVKIVKPNGEFVVKTRLYIDLKETPSIFLVEIVGSWIPETDETIEAVKENNEKYKQTVKRHNDPKAVPPLAHDFGQTFESYKLSVYTDYKIESTKDVASECKPHLIEDEFRRTAAEDVKKKIRENEEKEAQLLADKELADAPEVVNSDDDSSSDEVDTTVRVDLGLYKDDENRDDEKQFLLDEASGNEIPMSSEDDEEVEINMTLQAVYDNKRHKGKQKNLRILPDINFSIIALERIICMDSQQEVQADMRGFSGIDEFAKPVGPAAVEEVVGEVVDEDAMVDLLIQQHRLQEQLEKEGEGEDVKRVPGEITEADIARMEAELEAEKKAREEEEDESHEVEAKVEEPPPVVEEEEKDAFDLALEDGAVMDFGDDGLLLDDQIGGDRFGEGDRDREGDDDYAERFGFGMGLDDDDGEEEGIVGNMRCEWTDYLERDEDLREDALLAQSNEEPIIEEKLDLIPADDDVIDYVPTTLPPDPVAIAVDKKEMFEGLGEIFPDIVKKSAEPTQEEIVEQEVLLGDLEDDVSDQSDPDPDSQLSDHCMLEEDVEYSSDVLSEDDFNSNAHKELVHLKENQTAHGYRQYKSEMVIPHLEVDGPFLKQFWNLNAKFSTGKEVTDIALHPSNGNLIAVGYGTCQFGKEMSEGHVCIWNAKNNRNPERLYSLKSPVTSLAFSEFTPYVLAIGMMDGNIVLYDARDSDPLILWSTYSQDDKHIGPVWVIYWLVEEDSANELSVAETMMSLGDDGYLKRWSMAKGMESADVMKVMRSTMQIPGRREKRNESLITTLSTAYTVCFFPDNTELFLMGTEEGFIHKCSTAYKDQYVSTFVGHTGPVYRVCFSVFDDSVFVSCGGDWTIRIWKTDHPSPLLTLNTGLRTIFDVACSLYSSTIFICCAEFHIEVWDLSINTLEPAVHHKVHSSNDVVGYRKVAFNGYLNSVIIGDDEGGIHIFGLRSFPKPQTGRSAQKDSLMEALLPGYKKRQVGSGGNDGEPQTLKSIFVQKDSSSASTRGDRDEHGRAKSTWDEHGRAKSTWDDRAKSIKTDEHGRAKSTIKTDEHGRAKSTFGRSATLVNT